MLVLKYGCFHSGNNQSPGCYRYYRAFRKDTRICSGTSPVTGYNTFAILLAAGALFGQDILLTGCGPDE